MSDGFVLGMIRPLENFQNGPAFGTDSTRVISESEMFRALSALQARVAELERQVADLLKVRDS